MVRSLADRTFQLRHTRTVASLNLGGRNLNPFEFVLEGDDSAVGQRATELRLRAQAAVVDAEHGPKSMERAEAAVLRDRSQSSVLLSNWTGGASTFSHVRKQEKCERKKRADRVQDRKCNNVAVASVIMRREPARS